MGPLRTMAEYIHEIVCAATASPKGRGRVSGVRCRRRPGGKRCPGRIHVAENDSGHIEWECTSCRRGGAIHGWQGSFSDLSEIRDDDAPYFEVAVTEEEYDQLKKCLAEEPEADLVVHSATCIADGLVLRAGAGDIHGFADLLESKIVLMKKGRRREALNLVLKRTRVVLGHWHPD